MPPPPYVAPPQPATYYGRQPGVFGDYGRWLQQDPAGMWMEGICIRWSVGIRLNGVDPGGLRDLTFGASVGVQVAWEMQGNRRAFELH